MKILLRDFQGEHFVWREAKWTGRNFAVEDDLVSEINIVSVADDDRSKYLRCAWCGEIIRNTKASIEKHRNINNPETCLTCSCMKPVNKNIDQLKYTKQEDGTYVVQEKSRCNLFCFNGYSWQAADINSNEARRMCKHKHCDEADLEEIQDIFTKYPGVFDDLITSDKIIETGFKVLNRMARRIHFQLKGRNDLWAVCNKKNIVDKFILNYRRETYEFVYSKKYQRLFMMRGGAYREDIPYYDIPTETIDYITRKIAKLYE